MNVESRLSVLEILVDMLAKEITPEEARERISQTPGLSIIDRLMAESPTWSFEGKRPRSIVDPGALEEYLDHLKHRP
jgi:hypothetical protein